MKAFLVLCGFALSLVLSAPILVADGIRDSSRPAIGSQPCSAIFAFVADSRMRQLLIECDKMLLEKYAYLADRWLSFSASSLSTTAERVSFKSLILPDRLPTSAPGKQLGARPASTSTSTTSPASSMVISAYANRIRLEDIVASRDLPAFLDWLSARPIMAWTLIVAVLIIVFFVSAVVVEIAVALWKVVDSSNTKRRSRYADSELFSSGEIYLPGTEKKLAAVILIDEPEENLLVRGG
ncbi:hypothetical protein MferCBS31731_002432 [Microsporum ferrugineum]